MSLASLELGPYSHFMQKEINEQPRAVSDTAEIFLEGGFVADNFGEEAPEIFAKIQSIKNFGVRYFILCSTHWQTLS